MEENRQSKYSRKKQVKEESLNEEKLGMTRELKFKALQEEIEKEKEINTIKKKRGRPRKPIFEDEDEIPVSIDELEKTLASKSLRETLDNIIEEENKETVETIVEAKKKVEKELKEEKEEIQEKEVEVQSEEETSKEEQVEETLEEDEGAEDVTSETDVKEVKEEKNVEDDLYLTTSLKPFRKRFRLRKLFRVLFSLIFIVGLLYAAYIFCVKPIYNFYLNTKPLAVYNNTIDMLKNKIVDELNSDYYNEESANYEIKMNVNSKKKDQVYMNNKTFGLRFGYDKKRNHYNSRYMVSESKEYALTEYRVGSQLYYNVSSSNTYLRVDKEEYEEIGKIGTLVDISEIVFTGRDDTIYYVEHVLDIVKDNIKEDMIKSSSEEIDITGTSIKAYCHKLTLEDKKREEFYNGVINDIMRDDKLVRIIASNEKIDKQDVRKFLRDKYLSSSKSKDVEEFSLYTVKGTKVIGFDYEVNGFRKMYLYVNNKNFEFHVDLTKECPNKKKCKVEQDVYDLVGTYMNEATNVELKHNTNLEARFTVRDLTNKSLDIDYEFYIDDIRYKGSINKKTDKYFERLDLSMKNDTVGTTYDFNVLYGNKHDFLKKSDIKKEVKYTDKAFNSRVEELYSGMTEDEISAFVKWMELIDM